MEYLEKLSGKKIAVIGLGYIGRHLANFLNSRREKGDFVLFEINRQNLHLIETQNFDYVFNCAGNTGDFREQPVKTVESNINLNLYLLEKCKINEALICLSSTRIYGFTQDESKFFTEDDFVCQNHLSLDSIYDNSKKLMECLLMNVPTEYRKIVVRLSNVFGNYNLNDLDDSTFLKLMLRFAFEKEKLLVRQNTNSTKDYIYIDDALDGILRAGILSQNNEVYNVCSGKSYSVKDWSEFIGLKIEEMSNLPTLWSNVSNKKAFEKVNFKVRRSLSNLKLNEIIRYE